MPAPSRITPALIDEVALRRAANEPWKTIGADLRRRALPTDRATWWRAGVAQRHDAGHGAAISRTQPA